MKTPPTRIDMEDDSHSPITQVPFAPPNLSEAEIASVVETLKSGWITTGPKVHEFENAFAVTVGAKSALALSSGTAGLHLALELSEVKPGQAVILSPYTFCSCAHVIEQVGGVPCFVDVESDTLNMDPDLVEAAIQRLGKNKIRGVMCVHFAGHPCEMESLVELARHHDLALIEDAAHSFPSRYRGHFVGSPWEDLSHWYASFSFYATKTITTGEGGMLVGSEESLESARVLSRHGISRDAWQREVDSRPWSYDVDRCGYKYNMTDIQAAIGLCQLEKNEAFNRTRRWVSDRYRRAFQGEEALVLPIERDRVESSWHLYVLRLADNVLRIDRGRFLSELAKKGIGTSVHFRPLTLMTYFQEKYGHRPGDFPVAERAYSQAFSLPIHSAMDESSVDSVIQAVLDLCKQFRR